MVYVTSDLHGFPLKKFLALCKQAGFSRDDDLYILGDVIDRHGDGGVAILQWMMEQDNVHLLLGNHEAMLLACSVLLEEVTEESIDALTPETLGVYDRWMRNGAQPTLAALRALYARDPALVGDILDMLRDAPLYEVVSIGERDFVLTHAGLGGFEKGKRLSAYTPDELLWNRPKMTDCYFERAFTVFGHTPTEFLDSAFQDSMLLTETWADVDTGAACGRAPMLLRLDDMQAFYWTECREASVC